MRVFQSAVPTSGLLNNGLSVEQCLVFNFEDEDGDGDLINDGSGGGVKIENPIFPSTITESCGLILTAKNVSTMLKGLSKIKQDQVITGKSGLCVVAMQHNDHGLRSAKMAFNTLNFTGEHLRRGFISGVFPIASFFTAVYTHAFKSKDNDDYYEPLKKMNKAFSKMGGGRQKVTFDQFKRAHGTKMTAKCVMVMVCLTKNLKVGEKGSNFTVIRNIKATMTAGEFRSVVRRAFEGTDMD